jgi:hypothetical protein
MQSDHVKDFQTEPFLPATMASDSDSDSDSSCDEPVRTTPVRKGSFGSVKTAATTYSSGADSDSSDDDSSDVESSGKAAKLAKAAKGDSSSGGSFAKKKSVIKNPKSEYSSGDFVPEGISEEGMLAFFSKPIEENDNTPKEKARKAPDRKQFLDMADALMIKTEMEMTSCEEMSANLSTEFEADDPPVRYVADITIEEEARNYKDKGDKETMVPKVTAITISQDKREMRLSRVRDRISKKNHSRHSSLPSLDEDSIICERRHSFCSPPSIGSDNFSNHELAILGRTSPKINALCKRPRVLTLEDMDDIEFPFPSQSLSNKQFCAHDETNSTTIAKSSMGTWEGNGHDLSHGNPSDYIEDSFGMSEEVASQWQIDGSSPHEPALRRVSLSSACSPNASNLEDIAFRLGSISLYSGDRSSSFRPKRPSLHRRLSFNMLPSPDQIAAAIPDYPPPRHPAMQRRVSMPSITSAPRRRHRRNTTQIVLPPK